MSLNTLPADRLPAVRRRCAVDVRTPPPPDDELAVQRRQLGLAGWFFVLAIAFFATGALASITL